MGVGGIKVRCFEWGKERRVDQFKGGFVRLEKARPFSMNRSDTRARRHSQQARGLDAKQERAKMCGVVFWGGGWEGAMDHNRENEAYLAEASRAGCALVGLAEEVMWVGAEPGRGRRAAGAVEGERRDVGAAGAAAGAAAATATATAAGEQQQPSQTRARAKAAEKDQMRL